MVMVMGINIGKKEDAHNNDSGQMPSNWCMHSLLRIRIIIIIVEMHLFGSFHLEEASGSGIKELKGLECRQCGKYGRFMGQMVVTDIGPRMLPTD